MPFVKFLQDRSTVEEVPQVFKAGQVVELSPESCERWIRRGAAIDWTDRLDVSQTGDEQQVLIDVPHTETLAEQLAGQSPAPKPAAKRGRKGG
jgi:hypothetical protein